MKPNKKYSLIFTLIILVLTLLNAPSFGSNTNIKIDYLNDRLSVVVEKLPLGSVLEKIQEKTGVDFMLGKEDADNIISVNFQSLPVEKALKRILNQFNYAVLFDSKGRACKVIVIGALEDSFYTSNMINIKPPIGQDMKITHDRQEMKIAHSGQEMEIAHDRQEMKTTHGGVKMKITHDGQDMKITHDRQEMKIAPNL